MGHIIKLGTTSTLRNYSLKAQGGDGIAWSRGPANPFAAKVNTSNLYDSVDSWNEWVQEDWQTGVGRVDPQEGGFLYAELDSRVPNQLILPQGVDIYTPVRSVTTSAYEAWSLSPGQLTSSTTRATRTLTTGSGSPYFAWRIQGDLTTGTGVYAISAVWVYAEAADGAVLRADIYSNSSGSPNASLANGSLTVSNDYPGPQWHKISVTYANADAETEYWIVVRPTTGSVTLHGTGNLANFTAKDSADGSTWSSAITTFQPFFMISSTFTPSASDHIITKVHAITYSTHANGVAVIGTSALGNTWLVAYTKATDGPYLSSTRPSTAAASATISATIYENSIYMGDGSDTIRLFAVGLGSSGTISPFDTDLLYSFGGYLWRTFGNDLYYYGTPGGWTSVGVVCSDPYKIRSMAGLNRDLYMACDDGLYRLAPGDVVEGIAPWQPSTSNGRAMVTWGGALYVIVHGRVWRYGQEGSWRDVWVSRDDDLPANRLGEVVALTTTDLGVVALVNSSSGGRSSVWVYQDEGWHHLTTLPTTAGSVMYYDRDEYKIWIGTTDGYVFGVYMPANALNPYNDTDSIYMPAGWQEQDRFYGGQYLLDKDFESVTIVGDNLSANVNVKVYWQDEGSTAWELLGTADSDGEELRWSNHSTRPQGKWIKLGVLLSTNDADETPRVRAIVTKFLPMIMDRVRDTVTLTLKDYIEMPDGDPDDYTLAQQLAHIESLIGSVIPIIYQDPLGVQYEAKIVDYSMSMVRFDYYNGANKNKEMDVTLVLEQMPNSAYSA